MNLFHVESQHRSNVKRKPKSAMTYVTTLPVPGVVHLGHVYAYTILDCWQRFTEFQRRANQPDWVSSPGVDSHRALREEEETGRVTVRRQWSAQFGEIMQALNVCQPDDDVAMNKLYTSLPLAVLPLDGLGGVPQRTPPTLDRVSEWLTCYSPDTLRFYLASHYYRGFWRFSEGMLLRAAEQAITLLWALDVPSGQQQRLDPDPIARCAIAALADDLNTPCALTALLYLADEILAAAAAGGQVEEAQTTLRALSKIMGLRLGDPPDERVLTGWQPYLSDRKITGYRMEPTLCEQPV